MTAPQLKIRIAGKNSDGDYWLYIDGASQKAGLNLGEPKGMIASALLMAASGHTYTRTDLIPNAAYVAGLESALRHCRDDLTGWLSITDVDDNFNTDNTHSALQAANAALSARPDAPDTRVVTIVDLIEIAIPVVAIFTSGSGHNSPELFAALEAAALKIRALIGEVK